MPPQHPRAPLFLFVGFSVGMVGWPLALALFCFSETIAYLTIGSFAALVTNGRMKGGGAYYMITRSLGPALGGSSGLLFWLTYCINVTFNTSAFTDTVFSTWFPQYASCTLEDSEGPCFLKVGFSTGVLFLLFVVAYIGAAAFARVNYLIFAGLALALVVSISSVWLSQADRVVVARHLRARVHASRLTSQFANVTASYRPGPGKRRARRTTHSDHAELVPSRARSGRRQRHVWAGDDPGLLTPAMSGPVRCRIRTRQ